MFKKATQAKEAFNRFKGRFRARKKLQFATDPCGSLRDRGLNIQKRGQRRITQSCRPEGVGRYRARMLFDRGIRTREQLLSEQNYIAASRILGEGTLRHILEENGMDVSKIELTTTKQVRLG